MVSVGPGVERANETSGAGQTAIPSRDHVDTDEAVLVRDRWLVVSTEERALGRGLSVRDRRRGDRSRRDVADAQRDLGVRIDGADAGNRQDLVPARRGGVDRDRVRDPEGVHFGDRAGGALPIERGQHGRLGLGGELACARENELMARGAREQPALRDLALDLVDVELAIEHEDARERALRSSSDGELLGEAVRRGRRPWGGGEKEREDQGPKTVQSRTFAHAIPPRRRVRVKSSCSESIRSVGELPTKARGQP